MAVITIPQTATEQPQQNQSLNDAGSVGLQRSFKDTYANLKTFADGISVGDTLGSTVVKSYSLARAPANLGVLTLNLVPEDTTGTETVTQTAQLETWSLKSVRNDMSLLAYCGASEGTNPFRVHVELWLKETNAEIADANKYRKSENDTAGTSLSTADVALVNKYRKGYESVMRFYPLLTRTRVYSRMPQTVYENLAYIDTPTVDDTAKTKERPGNLASIISSHSWLKCQDDLQKNADGTFSRVESWMGVLTSERTWDENFYGTSNRWPMPYQGS